MIHWIIGRVSLLDVSGATCGGLNAKLYAIYDGKGCFWQACEDAFAASGELNRLASSPAPKSIGRANLAYNFQRLARRQGRSAPA